MPRKNDDPCPEWCVEDHSEPGRGHRSAPIDLARPEVGTGACTARLVSGDGQECEVLFERWTRREWKLRLSLDATDSLLDALDDGGREVMQRLAGLIREGTQSNGGSSA